MSQPKPKFILHIEDDEDDQSMVEEAIRRSNSGAIIRKVNNGEQGLLFLKQCKIQNDIPGLIILDVNMPGMDGKRVIIEIKKDDILSSVPIVFFTTSSSVLDKMFAEKAGVSFITKPSKEADFFEAVGRMIELYVEMN